MFSSDYPHSVTLWPNSRRHATTLTANLPPDVASKILAGNAARLYGV
jgi:predicted TIM-barrel fold metal-dependent hydrolase